MTIYSGADDWQALHELPDGAILIDGDGHAYQIQRPKDRDGFERWPGETWASPVSDEYAFIVRHDDVPGVGRKVGSYMPEGNLTLVWQPS